MDKDHRPHSDTTYAAPVRRNLGQHENIMENEMKFPNTFNVYVLIVGFTVLSFPLPAMTVELTRDNASKPIVFLKGPPVPIKVKYQGREYEICYRDPNTNRLIPKTHFTCGTGFIVGYHNQTYLVTARHLAQKTSVAWSATISGPNDLAVPFPFTDFTGYTKDLPWVTHPLADVAVLRLADDSKYCRSGMVSRFDISVFVRTAMAPAREKVLTIVGFPLALGVRQKISPLTKETKAASGLYEIPKGASTITVFFLSDPGIQGYSGSPVFAFPIEMAVRGATVRVGWQTQCYGLVSATLSDKTGGKLAQVVPSSQIYETILRAYEHRKENKEGAKTSAPENVATRRP